MNTFGSILREWRNRRRFSQLDLASAADISARHVSFMESGRANPSREMVIRLANTLNIEPVDVNAGLLSAGYSPAFPVLDRDADSLSAIRRAIDSVLANHSPWPAIACDATWNLLQANDAALHVMQLFNLPSADNIMQALLSSDDPAGPLLNWPEVARLILMRLQAEQLQRPHDELLAAVAEQLRNHPRIGEDIDAAASDPGVVIPLKVRATAGETISLFSMLAQFGSVREITMSDMKIELFFPADDDTVEYFAKLVN